jgi:chromosome segregation ATPase
LQTKSHASLVKSEVATLVKQLSRKHHSAALAQLASRIAAVAKYSSGAGDDPFAKIKGLITDMIEKLNKEAGEEAEEKAYCDEEMAKTESKKGELDDTVAKLTAKIDQDAAQSTELKDEVKEAQSDLATLTKEQGEMDKIRREENADYTQAKADLTLGLTGVRKALEVLRDYYGAGSAAFVQGEDFMKQPAMPKKHEKSGGAASSIIGILEVCESDFASNLAKEETQESDAASAYEKTTQSNKIEKSTLEQDVKYKTVEFKGLDKKLSELNSDRDTTNTELSAVNDYFAKIKERCIAKPESYEERKRRREAEIAGLKEALTVLENEVAFVQRERRGSSRQTFLGTM